MGTFERRGAEGMDILIVESDSTTSDLIDEVILNTDALKSATIAKAITADQGNNLLMTAAFDLIVIDLAVPGFDPGTALPSFRQTHPATPIIVIAGAITAALLTTLHRATACAVLIKPIRPEDLQPILVEALKPAGAPRAA
jgi:DNA-binding NtrC family response regulator